MNQKNIDKIVTEALAIEAETAKEAGTLGFMARALVQATMPHKKIEENEFKRTNGAFSLIMLAPSTTGLPYGSIPRLLIAWLTTEAVKTQSRELELGNTLSQFMRELSLMPTGGRWGSITRLKEQMTRLFSCFVTCSYINEERVGLQNIMIADEANLWWSPKQPDQAALWRSSVKLSERFFNEIIENPVPIDLRALKALRRSPLALDIYVWLTYRMSYLKQPTTIPWPVLQTQFGCGYAMTPQGTSEFKRAFLRHLQKIYVVYPNAKLESIDRGLLLSPSKTHVSRSKKPQIAY